MSRYQDAGVDVNAGYELVHRIKDAVKSTDRPGVIGGIGSFGGMFDLEKLWNFNYFRTEGVATFQSTFIVVR